MLARLSALGRNFAIYGLGDVATNIVSFLLLPLYTRFLSPEDYGAISLLLTVEVVAKIVFRCGLDASFMRLFYDCETDADRQRLASTIFWFLAASNGVILALLLLAAPFVSSHLFGVPGYTLALVLQLLYTFVVGFYFIPFHVMRMEGQSRQFTTLTTTRATATLVMRLVLIVGFGLGVLGFVLADVIVGIVFTGILARWFRPLLRFTFSRAVLDQALRFGLPRLPHGVAQQVMAVGDRYILRLFGTLAEVGVYSIGASFGLALKLALSAFEYAWAPFYYETMKQPDAKQTFTLVTTYGIGVLVLLEAGLAAIAPEVVRLMTTTEFYGARGGDSVDRAGCGVQRRVSADVDRPEHHEIDEILSGRDGDRGGHERGRESGAGAALRRDWRGVGERGRVCGAGDGRDAILAAGVSGEYEWGRLARLAIAGGGAFAIAWMVPDAMPAWLGLLVRGSIVVAAYPLLLVVLGFYDRRELAFVGRLVTRGRQRGADGGPW